jgi:transcriptional regulator with PAS, ATPase and Fis domain
MKKSKTNWLYQGQPFDEPNNMFGFVYLVTCNHPEYRKKYIGRKFFYTNFGKKTKQKESDWATYKTSSNYVKEAINKYGLEYFTFEIIQLFATRAGVVSGEVELQWAARVLHAVDDSGERLYINQAIGNIKFISKEQISEEHKQKIIQSNKTRTISPETRVKMSNAQKGNTNGLGNTNAKGIKQPKEANLSRSIRMIGNKNGMKKPNEKAETN